MFGWWKRNDGFEWHKYVRTTIALRRDARREKALRLKQQAADGVKAAGAAASEAAREGARNLGAGSRIALVGAAVGLGRLVALARPLPARLASLFMRVARQVRPVAASALRILSRALPTGTRSRVAAAVAGAVAIGAGSYAMLPGSRLLGSAVLPSIPYIGSTTVSGRSVVVGPGLLRIGTSTIRLTGIEPPERQQVCTRNQRRWRCGEGAIAALTRLTQGRTLTCTLRGTDPTGNAKGVCYDKDTDIAAALVKGGHVFAEASLLAGYGSVEAEARSAKVGLWSGEAERPAVWRARIWDDAKKRTPDGCPIKGKLSGGARLYVLPWSRDYTRVRVDARRGGRWFCTEKEALEAGWKPALRI
jgi:endonuclease YncB( thermonuclease family)